MTFAFLVAKAANTDKKEVMSIIKTMAVCFVAGLYLWLICWYCLPASMWNPVWACRTMCLRVYLQFPVDTWIWRHAFEAAQAESMTPCTVVMPAIVTLIRHRKAFGL